MNKEAALNSSLLEPDFLGVSGSRLYGTNRPTSDEDFRGFVMSPYEYLLGFQGFDDRDIPGADHKVFSVARFLELTLKGDPQLTELFFLPEEKVVRETQIGKEVRALRDKIVSNVIFRRILGYGNSEFRKAMGVKMEVDDLTIEEDALINHIRNLYGLEKQDMDDIVDIIRSRKPRRIVSSKKDFGAKRRAEFEKFGFGVTCAAHSIRLSEEVTELMLTGKITFPRPNAQVLLDIRLGKYDVQQVTEMYENAKAQAEEARPKSVLPDKPDRDYVEEQYLGIVQRYLLNDHRFNSSSKLVNPTTRLINQ